LSGGLKIIGCSILKEQTKQKTKKKDGAATPFMSFIYMYKRAPVLDPAIFL